MIKKYIILATIGVISVISVAQAQRVKEAWDIQWVDIITRQDWWANEALRIRQEWRWGLFPKSEKVKTAENYVLENFPEDFVIDREIGKMDDDYITWELEYSNKKKAIVIHHTATDYKKVEQDWIKKHLQDIYKFHTLTRDWWDVWYNFLLDKEWNVFEWRYGGKGVIGAHSRWNNSNTLWISLIGDYNIDEPTNKQWQSLVMLVFQLSLMYDIDPFDDVTFHRSSADHPYIEHTYHDAIVWHRDATSTTCPGENIYKRIPQLKKDVSKLMLMWKNNYRIREMTTIADIQRISSPTNNASITLDYSWDRIDTCEFVETTSLQFTSCKKVGDTVQLNILRNSKPTNGQHMIRVKDIQWFDSIYYITLQRETDIAELTQQRVKKHSNGNGTEPSLYPKVTNPISYTEAIEIREKDVTVLLRELSEEYLSRDIQCDNCVATIETASWSEKISRGTSTLHVEIFDDETLVIATNTTWRFASSIEVQSTNKEIIAFNNYSRASYAGIPWNRFYDTVSIHKEKNKEGEEAFVVTNTLPFKAYIMWVVETNDQEHSQKNKVMAIIAKQYMVHYLSQWHRHPNIPEWASYQAIDDPDQFQKYVWAWTEKTLKKWPDAVLWTRDTFIMNGNKLAFTPYFSCSPWVTRAASSVRWRNDTPYLKPVLDWSSSACVDYQGHGVGLSWKGAEYMATRGVPHDHILRYYYPWTTIQTK